MQNGKIRDNDVLSNALLSDTWSCTTELFATQCSNKKTSAVLHGIL